MKLIWQLFVSIVYLPGYKLLLALLWLLVLTIFLWLPQVNLLAYILTQAPLDLGGKVSFLLEYYVRVLSGIGNPAVLSMVIFSVLTAISIMLLIFMVRTSRRMKLQYQMHGKVYSGVAAAAIGSHMLSCGGMLLLASVFPALSGTSTILGGNGAIVNLWLSTGANLIGISIVVYTINKLSKDIAGMILNPRRT